MKGLEEGMREIKGEGTRGEKEGEEEEVEEIYFLTPKM